MMHVSRVIVIVMDSVGIGEAPDAASFGDTGSNTLGNTARAVGGLALPNMATLGLGNIAPLEGVRPQEQPAGAFGKLAEVSAGKDTSTGHWELMGVHLARSFPVYPEGFPRAVMQQFEAAIGRETLGNYASSGTVILDELGETHVQTGKPIVYTSADSVFQIAAHEEVVPVDALYHMCSRARAILRGEHEVLRVIARPFVGAPGSWTRTANRRDFSVTPPELTLLDFLKNAGRMVYAVGKIEDIFAGCGITDAVHTEHNMDGVDKTLAVMRERREHGLIFTNLVDFDAKYGHRNDPAGYARCLAEFDQRVPELLAALRDDDILVITADHGNDPTTPSTDHSREYVPIMVVGSHVSKGVNLGTRETFSDLSATIAELLGVQGPKRGTSFVSQILKA